MLQFLLYFYQVNAALVSRKDFLKKHNLTNYVKLLNNHQNQAAIVSAAPVVTNVFARSRCL